MEGSSGVDETSPDLLRNTPLNIRRLVNEIELCEGRKKYLGHTRSPSDGSDVRWYFCKVPLAEYELAASVPLTEIVGKGDYFRFGMRDSLAIEASFLQREDELLSSWWKEYAECSEGPKGNDVISNSTLQRKELFPECSESDQLYTSEGERVGVPVKGGLYEVDLVRRHCFPVYWNGENRRVLRGHWFASKGGLDWLPLREDVSEQLEYAYRTRVWNRRTFQASGLFAARVDLQGSTPGLHALFTGEDDTWEAWLRVDASGFSGAVGFGGNGIKLRRGYAPSQSQKPTKDEFRQQKEEEMDDYCSQVPVRHLVFVVHGIGQRLEKSNLVDDVGEFRHVTASVAERHLTSHQLGTQRVLYIPCQWRKGLKFSGEVAVDKITLDGVRGLRTMLSATVHDILYYMSPIYCQEIIDSVSNQLNKLYLKFLKRNPGYDGKVSLYGHSLGSVLSYDILCHQETLYSPFPMECMYRGQTRRSCMGNDVSSGDYPVSNFRDGSSVNNEFESTDIEGTTNALGPPVSSDADSDDAGQPNETSSSIDENISEFFHYSHHEEFDRHDMMNDPSSTDDRSDDSKDEIIKSLRNEVDLLKEKIKEFEAEYAGKEVSNRSKPEKDHPRSKDSVKSYTPQIRYTKLEFKVDTFFAVGSPLGVFLSLRNVRIGIGKGKEYWNEENINEEMPACRQMLNIFHPFDPVAYRIEPLICKEFIHKRSVIIPYHRGGKRLYIGFEEFKERLALRSRALVNHLDALKVKVLTLCESRDKYDCDEQSQDSQDDGEKSYGSVMMDKLTGSETGRIDHVLQDKTFRHPYISAIGAHTNYWRDPDTALFILRYLYRDVPEEPSDSKDKLKNWSDPRKVADEELPLTFAEGVFIKHFSYKVKKMSEN